MTRASEGRLYREARAMTLDWTLFITRGLARTVAADRRAEIVSDLWEHAATADARGRSRAALGISVLARLVRGLPADLGWRRGALRGRRRAGTPPEEVSRGSSAERRRITLAEGHLFDQTNGALVTQDLTPAGDDGTPLLIGLAGVSNAANLGWTGGNAGF